MINSNNIHNFKMFENYVLKLVEHDSISFNSKPVGVNENG